MKVIFDLDGTMTDYHAYIENFALPWFFKKYGLRPVNPDELELEDILDLQNVMQIRYGKELIDRYWISHRFIHYALLTRFRPGCLDVVRKLKALGCQVEIYTSRAHAARQGFIGGCTRFFTRGQLWLNGVRIASSQIHYFQNDEDKLTGIFQANPQLVFDDKAEILEALRQRSIPAVCLAEPYNAQMQTAKGLERIAEYSAERTEELLEKAIGPKAVWQLRAARSDVLWKKLSRLAPLVRWCFKPVVLNADRRILTDDAVLYAPNHRSTLDPLVILSVVKENIHWAALLRFFQAEDSIFNNNKNPLLCRITAWLFRSLAYFPINRKTDDSNADNLAAIQDMIGFLKISEKIGIFGEGTTRRPEGQDFGVFDRSIIVLAKKTNAWIQPVTICWIDAGKKKKRPILNFGTPFQVGAKKTNAAMDAFLEIQKECLRENMDYA